MEWGLGWTGSESKDGCESQSGYGFESEFESGSTGHRKEASSPRLHEHRFMDRGSV